LPKAAVVAREALARLGAHRTAALAVALVPPLRSIVAPFFGSATELLGGDPGRLHPLAQSRKLVEVGADEYAHRTGVVPVASFTASKLRWLRDAEPENAARVAAVALPHDWLTWRLRGYGPVDESPLGPVLEELKTDRSEASGTGYWSPATGEYDLELFERALGHPAILPRVLGPGMAAGTTVALPGSRVPAGIVVGPGAGDNAGAALGLGAGAGDVVVSIGTSGTVFAVAERPAMDPTGAVAGFADASGLFLPLVATLNAARVLGSIAELLGVDHDGLARLALEAEPGCTGVVLVPYFEGEPLMMGLSRASTKAALAPLRARISVRSRSRIRLSAALLGLISSLPACRRTVNPRKSKPSSRVTTRVLSSLKARPLGASHSASRALTCAASSLVWHKATRSSAYLIRTVEPCTASPA